VTVIEPLEFDAPRTRRVASMLKSLGVAGSCLIAVGEENPMLCRSSRNVPDVSVLRAKDLNALDVLAHRRLLLTRDVVEGLAGVLR
jgi:large subunit ribosomal protein L4